MREVTTKRLSGDPQVVWAAFSWRGLPSNTKNELLASIRAVKLDVPVSCYVERAALRCVMQVVVGDAMHWAPSIERQIFKCPAARKGRGGWCSAALQSRRTPQRRTPRRVPSV
jgi:hypothetical protein